MAEHRHIANIRGPEGPEGPRGPQGPEGPMPDFAHTTETEGLLAAVNDLDGRMTWLSARSSDGGPTDHAESMLRERLGVTRRQTTEDLLAAVTDSQGTMTDLAVRASDGQVPDWVLDRWARRLGLVSERPVYAESVQHTPGSQVHPISPRADRWALWGSSTAFGIRVLVDQLAQEHGASLFRAARGGERMHDTAVRYGSYPIRLTFPGDLIPSSGSVEVQIEAPVSRSMLWFQVRVAGVLGELNNEDGPMIFTRAEPGDPVALGGPVMAVSVPGEEEQASTHIFQVGKNTLTLETSIPPETVARMTMDMVRYQAALYKRCLVLGQFVDTDTPADSPIRERIYASDRILARELGPLFVDTHGWITSEDLWSLPGAPEPTSEDLQQQAMGNLPPSIARDRLHLNDVGNQLYVDHLIRPAIQRLAWPTAS